MDLHLQRYPEIFALKMVAPEHADEIIRHLTPVLSSPTLRLGFPAALEPTQQSNIGLVYIPIP
jgi:hypothetical protein